jgi:hypothetical protein
MSPLVAAASRGDVAEVRRFLKAGVPVSELDIRDGTDVSAMHTNVCEGHIPVVRCLIKEGVADIDSINYMGAISPQLSLAAMCGKYPLAQWLIEEGAMLPTAHRRLEANGKSGSRERGRCGVVFAVEGHKFASDVTGP